MGNNPFLSVKDLRVEYTSDKKAIYAVNGVSFELEKGKSLGLVGETGAGKTTIAKSIMRILQCPPACIKSGEIYLDGEDLLQKSEKDMLEIRGKEIAMIFQDPMSALNPLMTVGEQIAEVVATHDKSLSKHEAEQKAIEMMEMVGIVGSRAVEFPFQFSGGMKQRIVIAIALACNPQLLLADEPTTALDVTIQAQVLRMIKDLQDKIETSMILITHDLGVVAETCDTVNIVYAGKILEKGTVEEVFDAPTHPYTRGLFDSLPKLNEKTDRLTPIPGMPLDPSIKFEGCPFAPRCERATDRCRQGEIHETHLGGTHYCSCVLCDQRGEA
ncbi:MAG: ABC transporter ATP-binding protein [Oscillospiraceae bacterium]|nr:ABC transporter ATP-binding protein [Oscillospiraceae bacterium]